MRQGDLDHKIGKFHLALHCLNVMQVSLRSCWFCSNIWPMVIGLSFSFTLVSIFNILTLITNTLTCYSSIPLYLLPPREPLAIVAQVSHQSDQGIVLLVNCTSIWELVFHLKLPIWCKIIQLWWLHACMQIPSAASMLWLHWGDSLWLKLWASSHTFSGTVALSFLHRSADPFSSFQQIKQVLLSTPICRQCQAFNGAASDLHTHSDPIRMGPGLRTVHTLCVVLSVLGPQEDLFIQLL